MEKKFFKFLKKLRHWAAKFVVFLALIFALVAIALCIEMEAGFTTEQYIVRIKEVFTDVGLISTLLAAILSITAAQVLKYFGKKTEESFKTEDDHHKIIAKYCDHKTQVGNANGCKYTSAGNELTQDGLYMSVPSVDKRQREKEKIKNSVPNNKKYCDEYLKSKASIANYKENGVLLIPNVSVYANVNGNTKLVFNDDTAKFNLPPFVGENSLRIMDAHKTSDMSNGATIRLKSFEHTDGEDGGDKLVLKTERSQYFDMLLTNRCMDFELSNGLTLRKIYENGKKVSPLEASKLGNQIGINGVVVTNDGFLLVEKRGYRKTVWKNKFAQPISLALKVADLKLAYDEKIGDTYEIANALLGEKVILGTLKKNFGITSNDIVGFELFQNFLGIARDLLEGGKPNFYFYVVVNKNHNELKEHIEKYAKAECKDIDDMTKVALSNDKFQSDYYLVPYEQFKLSYDYELAFDSYAVHHIKRKYAPRFKMHQLDGNVLRSKEALGLKFKYDCGEALLACLHYVQLCKHRILNEKGEPAIVKRENDVANGLIDVKNEKKKKG